MSNKEEDISLANSYKNIMGFGAWHHLHECMEGIKNNATKELDSVPLSSLNVAVIAHAKGLREAITKLEKAIDFALNGGK